VTKEQWKWNKCKDCGTITDIDEKECPNRRWLSDNPAHELEVVELTSEEVKKAWKERRIYTKRCGDLERQLSQ